MRVLVLDDDDTLRALLGELAREVTPDVQTASDLRELVPSLVPYDVAIVDLLPLRHYDATLARDWVTTVRGSARRVIVVTGHAGAVEDGAGALGADLVLGKPFDIYRIQEALQPV